MFKRGREPPTAKRKEMYIIEFLNRTLKLREKKGFVLIQNL